MTKNKKTADKRLFYAIRYCTKKRNARIISYIRKKIKNLYSCKGIKSHSKMEVRSGTSSGHNQNERKRYEKISFNIFNGIICSFECERSDRLFYWW